MKPTHATRIVTSILVFSMLGVGIAYADTLNVDQINGLVTVQSATEAPNADGTVRFWLAVTNGTPSGDQNGCNADSTNPVIVTVHSTDSAVVAVGPPNAVTISDCGTANGGTVGYHVSATAANGATASLYGTVSGGKPNTTGSNAKTYLYDTSDTFVVTVSAPLPPPDLTPPVITATVSGTLGNNGWYVGDVEVSWTVEDPESAITSSSGCDPTTIDYDTDGETLTCEATSQGGTSSHSVTIKRDATPPDVTVTGVSGGAKYTLGSEPDPGCETSDATSGVSAEASLSVAGGPVGSITAECVGAEDVAGNVASASATYSVIYNWNGFFRPVDNPGTVNVAKAGSAIPAKFSLSGYHGLFIFSTYVKDAQTYSYPRSVAMTCDAGAPLDQIEQTATAGGSMLQYDAVSDTYNYVWKTEKSWAGTCRKLEVKLIDGETYFAYFKFTK